MNKRLINLVSDEMEVYKKDTKVLLECIFRNVRKVVSERGKLNIHGFGTFILNHRPERMARNPKTMEPYPIPEHYEIRFRPSDEFKEIAQES